MNRILAYGLVAYLIVGCGNEVETNHRTGTKPSQDAEVEPDLEDRDSERRKPRRRSPKPTDKNTNDTKDDPKDEDQPKDEPDQNQGDPDQPAEDPQEPAGPGPSSLGWDGTSFVHGPTLRIIPTE